MTRLACPSCRLRFTRAAAAYLVDCPACGSRLNRSSSAAQTVGFRLVGHADFPDTLAAAAVVAMPVPTREPRA